MTFKPLASRNLQIDINVFKNKETKGQVLQTSDLVGKMHQTPDALFGNRIVLSQQLVFHGHPLQTSVIVQK